MKITIEKSRLGRGTVITDTDGVRIPCRTEEDVLKEVRIFLYEIAPKDRRGRLIK